MSESAVSDKLLLLYGLARNRRSPKRPSEPRPSGAHPEQGEVRKDGAAYRLRVTAALINPHFSDMEKLFDKYKSALGIKWTITASRAESSPRSKV